LGLVVALEQVVPHLRTFARSAPVAVTGKGRISMPLELPDADANDPQYLPSRVGAEYRLHASLEKDGVVVSDTALPVQVGWGIRPVAPWPYPVVPGRSYPIGIQWEDLPSYLPGDVTPLDRARLWDSAQSTVQRYSVVLELRSQGNVVASASTLTRQSTGTNLFQVAVPASAPGPFTWTARLETAPNVASHDVEEGFEGYVRGAMWPGNMNAWYTPPWRTYQYPKELLQPGQQLWLNEGVQLNGSEGSQSAFQVVTNVAGLPYAGLGMAYEFPTTWALPDDAAGLAQYTFSFDFREASGAACNLELQLKDANGRFIAYPSPNQPPFAYAATNTWKTLSAKIAQFDLGPGQEGFDPHHIQALVVNVQMLKPAVMYVASFDNIRFVGPEVNLGGGTVAASYSSANDGAGTLSVTDDGTAVIISWTSHGVLQTAPESAGPWSDLSLLHSPVRVVPSEQQRFYQLRAP